MDFTKKDLSDDFRDELKYTKALYPDHVDSSTLMLQIKQGQYFLGRLQVSRFDITEATIKINGITNDVLIRGKHNLNRGLNMDMCGIEILPEDQWEQKGNRVDAVVTDLLEKEMDVDVKQDSDSEEENEETLNIVEKINQSTKQPMGKVVGVIQGGANSKNQGTKTYAGSTIAYKDLLEEDKALFDHIDVE